MRRGRRLECLVTRVLGVDSAMMSQRTPREAAVTPHLPPIYVNALTLIVAPRSPELREPHAFPRKYRAESLARDVHSAPW